MANAPIPNTGFIAISAGWFFPPIRLEASDARIVAWGYNVYDPTNVPGPIPAFIAVAGGDDHSLQYAKRPAISTATDSPHSRTTGPFWIRFHGPDVTDRVSGRFFDSDMDGDVDLQDWAAFQKCVAPLPKTLLAPNKNRGPPSHRLRQHRRAKELLHAAFSSSVCCLKQPTY